MPCQCATTTSPANAAELVDDGCQCASHPDSACECGTSAPTPSDRHRSLERLVMDLDKRLRRLEAVR